MINSFCTVITIDYVPFARALTNRLRSYGAYHYVIFIADGNKTVADQTDFPANTTFLDSNDLCTDGLGYEIQQKYAQSYMDGFRWSMKPVLMKYILENSLGDKVAYLDSDLFFYHSPEFLFELLDTYCILLSPHWRSSDPRNDYWQYLLLYTQGLYNGGFVASNRSGVQALEWWSKACLAHCEINSARGLFVDQAHLNLIPVYFPCSGIIQHRGCNVSSWNYFECRRSIDSNGAILINNMFPLIFIHFTPGTIKEIIFGRDKLLQPLLDEYLELLKIAGVKKDMLAGARKLKAIEEKRGNPTFFQRIKNRLSRLNPYKNK